MEKNINPQELSSQQVPEIVALSAKALVDLLKKEDATIHEIFNDYIDIVKKLFQEKKDWCPVCFFIFRDYKKPMWKAACYPMFNPAPGAMEFHAQVLRKLIREMKGGEQNEFKLVGVMRVMDAFVSKYERDEIMTPDGEIDRTKFVSPRNDPKAIDVLQFELEEIFVKHCKSWEYIKSDAGDIVYKDTPYIDDKMPFDEVANKNSNMAFLFTEGARQN